MAELLLPRPGDLALTVWQPWADLIVVGSKDVENRSWPPPSTLPQWEVCVVCDTRRTRAANDLGPDCLCEYPTRGSLLDDGPFPFRLWIHAGKHVDGANDRGQWDEWMNVRPAEDPRVGVLLGSVEVTGCHHADECYSPDGMHDTLVGPQYHDEEWCSRWAEPDCYHWHLADPQPLDTPIPMRGRQRLWRITADDKENHR